MSENNSLQNFTDQYPNSVRELFKIILKEGFKLTLVGGAVRDFFLKKEISKDLDFEIRSIDHLEGVDWLSKISMLGKKLERDHSYSVEKLSFNILRIKIEDYEVELSSPRLEEFATHENLGHSDFSPTFISNLSYKDAFKRRDFTINAIGVEFLENNQFKLIDPYNGVEDLKTKTLQYINDDFFKDPVRYLRALRFKVKLGFEFSRKLKDNIVYFKLEKLSLYYFLQEGRKIGLEKLIDEMTFTKRKFASLLPKWASEFDFINTSQFSEVYSYEDLLINYALDRKAKARSVEKLGEQLNIKKTLVRSLITLRDLSNINFGKAVTFLKGGDFESVCTSPELNSLTQARALKTKVSRELLAKFLDVDFVDFIFCELEGQELFLKLKKEIIPKQRSMLGIYCHIKSI